MGNTLQQTKELLQETWKEWKKDDATRIGAALAYYTTFSLAPLLVVATSVAGLVYGKDAAEGEVTKQLTNMLGEQGATQVQTMLANAHSHEGGVIATIVGTVAVLIGCGTVFIELQAALNRMWETPPQESKGGGILAWLKKRGLSFGLVLVIGFLLLVSLMLSAVLSGAGDALGARIELPPILLSVINFVVSTFVIGGLFTLLYKVLPDQKIPWGDVWVGGIVTALLFSLGKWLIGLYLGNSSVASAYGAAGSLAVVLIWIYYSAQLVLFGAEFTQVYANRHGSRSEGSSAARGERKERRDRKLHLGLNRQSPIG
jgi:membrane protein